MKIIALLLLCVTLTQNLFASADKPMSVRMVESEIARNPHPTMLDGMKGKLKWNYTVGLELLSFMDVARRYDTPEFVNYAMQFADTVVTNDNGEIYGYVLEKYNVDHICPGRVLMRAYDITKDKKYRRAVEILWDQVQAQPRTKEGGFWHKSIYPNQMWLDGLYMAQPFYGEYVKRYVDDSTKEHDYYADIVQHFTTVAKYTYDPSSELFRHAWDSSHEMFWADKRNGQSKHVWGRALGWYIMGLVETLDYMPKNHPDRAKMLDILTHLYKTLPKYADSVTGMWYQVLDMPERAGNYQEATASAMFVYSYLKGIRKGYLPLSYKAEVMDMYEKLVKRFVHENEDGTISLTDCCAVAGLGGKTMRSGTFDYYMSEPIIDNDCKGVGPFIWASLEYEAMKNIEYQPDATSKQVEAFPGALGAGKYTTGGRGGKVLIVDKLGDDGSEGTLRWAVGQKYPRTVVFNIAGNIELESNLEIKNNDITIAGQSAPGQGVCITNHPVIVKADNVIIRYMRFRMGDLKGNEADALGSRGRRNVIIDHCSISWSTDECASFYAMRNFTMQWCIISESLTYSVHKKGRHGYGAIWGGRNASYIGNIMAHHTSRNPRLDHIGVYNEDLLLTNRGSVELIGNTIYNWGYKACYGGEGGWWNLINNTFIASEGTTKHNIVIEASANKSTSIATGRYYISGNILSGNDKVNADNWEGVQIGGGYPREYTDNKTAFEIINGLTAYYDAEYWFKKATATAGASHSRDDIDKRILNEIKNRNTTYMGAKSKSAGHIDSQSETEGWTKLKGCPYIDSDKDGIPDKWERKNGLNPNNPLDSNKLSEEGLYTNIEVYLNSRTYCY